MSRNNNWDYAGVVSRSLIALLFVIAGIQKLMSFASTSQYITSLGVPASVIVTVLVILVEIPIALMFAWGYKVKEMGWVLIGFTFLATVLAHRDFSQGANMIMALKNVAIIGGILAAINCVNCDRCIPSKGRLGKE